MTENFNENCKTLKGIKFKVQLEGRGGINYDSGEQSTVLTKHCGQSFERNDNVNYLKKSFYKLNNPETIEFENGNTKTVDMGYYLKISHACLRHEIFGGTSDSDTVLWQFPTAACSFIASPLGYMRGYMNPSKGDQFNKKGVLTVTDAIDRNAAIVSEFYTKSGDRTDTSLYKKEMVGDTHYEFNAYFDVKQAQLLSLDDYFGRRAVSPTYTEGPNLLEVAFKRTYGRVPYEKGVYCGNSEIFGQTYGELGLKFDDEFVNSLIREAIKRLLSINIVRTTGEAHTVKVEYQPVYDCGETNDEWLTITLDMVNGLNFNIHQFYTEGSQHDWEERAKAIDEVRAATKAKKKSGKGKNSGQTKESESVETE